MGAMKKWMYQSLLCKLFPILIALSGGELVFGASARTVQVHLFEWSWKDIARECEEYLGPQGFAAVQISPPQEHRVMPGRPWFERYQPVSYILNSRSGTEQELKEMIGRCRAVGVDIYVDAVINHMSGMGDEGTEVGSAGSSFSHYNYLGLYQYQDFNHCPRPYGDISNYQDAWEVQHCELVNLADLKTDSNYVRQQIATYLNRLLAMGVAGFRIDAAKHIPVSDLKAIIAKLNKNMKGEEPYLFLEIIDPGHEPIKTMHYYQPLSQVDVTEFFYSLELSRIFKYGELAWLKSFGSSWQMHQTGPQMMPSDRAIVFVNNHDNERGHGAGGDLLTFRDGPLYELAQIFMLAWPYGYPQILSSYFFKPGEEDFGPPVDAHGKLLSPFPIQQQKCQAGWLCQHRRSWASGMAQFRNATADSFSMSNWQSGGPRQIAFARGNEQGSKGFVVINATQLPWSFEGMTGMSPGQYCDVIAAGCSKTVRVDLKRRLKLTIPAMSAVAIHHRALVK